MLLQLLFLLSITFCQCAFNQLSFSGGGSFGAVEIGIIKRLMENNLHKLKYRLIEASTEDPDNPLYELLRGVDSTGWVSVRFCTYPQEILLQFLTPVHLKKIHILSNEKKIASMLEFQIFSCLLIP